MKILVITPLFALAGVPLAQMRFARALKTSGHDVEFVIGHVRADTEFDPPEGLKTSIWGTRNARGMFWPLVRYLRKEEPDIVFSAEDHLNALVFSAGILSGTRAKISGSSRVYPLDLEGHRGPYSNVPFSKRWIFKQIMRVLMKRADGITCVAADLADEYRTLFKTDKPQGVYNIVVDRASIRRAAEPVDHPWFNQVAVPVVIGVGTLTHRKGFHDLMDAMGLLHDRGRDFRLVIVGEGDQRSALERQAADHGFVDNVWMPGNVANPLKYIAKSSVFVLASYSEGMPNVLVESMMCGCTPVAANCPTGPRELLEDGRFGFLVPMKDPAAMADAIESALDNPIPPERLEEAVAPFREETVIARHFELLGLPA